MKRFQWKEEASCKDMDNNLFFDTYEENESLRPAIDKVCVSCPVNRTCFANGISGKEWGVWGGVYIENGNISREFNKHKAKKDWGIVWKALTTE